MTTQDNGFGAALLKRRAFLRRSTTGIGTLALASLLDPELLRGADANAPKRPSRAPRPWTGAARPLAFAPKIKRVIYLYMAGGPSHLETFDYKPALAKMSGQPMPESFTRGKPIAQLQGRPLVCLAPQHTFQRCGASGQEMTTIFPHLATIADDICIVRSMVTEAINHDPAHTFMNTGTTISGRPAMGSWITYGLGSESENLPGFVVLTSDGKFGQFQPIATRQWHSGFLPSRFQGVRFYSKGDSVLYIGRPHGTTQERQRDIVDAVRELDSIEDEVVDDPEIATRIAAYETAFRMQTSVPELIDLSNESKHVLAMYGAERVDGSFAANCLLARRLAERGVRFIQLYHRDWDHHSGIKRNIAGIAAEVDGATAALIKDLKGRGMLDETLVIWGGEFGRTPMAQSEGRDHHIKGFSIFLAGGGIKPGICHGATDELGYNAVHDVVHVHDLHATILALFGIDHLRLVYRFQGRDFRLTDVSGEVVKPILA
jgi:hypothetical protein